MVSRDDGLGALRAVCYVAKVYIVIAMLAYLATRWL